MPEGKPTFKEIVSAALKNPQDASYGVREEVHSVPVGEVRQPWAVRAVRENPAPQGEHIVMGFAGLLTFDLAVASPKPPAGILLCDINSDQSVFWDAFLPLVKECDTAEALRERFSAMPDEMREVKFILPEMVKAARKRRNDWGEVQLEWLYDEEKYKKVRDMVLEGKVAHITLDVMDEGRYGQIAKMLADNELSVSALYLSNILKCMQEDETRDPLPERAKRDMGRRFWENQLSLCNDSTVIMSAEKDKFLPTDSIEMYTPREIRERVLGGILR
jgi:hypothetical protein